MFWKKDTPESLEKELQKLDAKKQAIEQKRVLISRKLQELFQRGH